MTKRLTILSQGAGCKMYTLWNFNSGSAYSKPKYIKNLSTDYDTALLLAERFAQDCETELGLGLMHNSRFYTNEQYAKQMEREQLMSQLQNGHHHTDNQRLDFTLTCIKQTGYESQFGYTNVYTFIDDSKKVYTYKGTTLRQNTKNPLYREMDSESVTKDMTITCKATIKHSTYKEQPVTFIQRLKIADK